MSNGFPVAALLAWLLAAAYYFYQYALRSAPSVMMPQLSEAFGVNALGVASIVGMFYYGYSPFSLVAGAAMDRFGAKRVIPIGAALVGAGALLFSTGSIFVASIGRFLQGAGGVFALVGAIYIATKYFPAAYAASLVGATQMFGMAGGSAGQVLVGPLINGGLPWGRFWIYAGFVGLAISATLLLLLPQEERTGPNGSGGIASVLVSLKTVFSNPQSILCGLIAGLLFIPTTILGMTWGVRFLQEGRGREYEDAVRIAASIPFGWMIGCPLLGFISDRIGRRKPVILGGALVLLAVLAWVLFGVRGLFRGAAVGIVMGIASGAAMVPYTVIKEVNPPELGGSATGVVNFINFTFSALLGPVFGRLLVTVSAGSESMSLEHYQAAFKPMLLGIVAALTLTCLLKETGPRARTLSK
ncbi:MAG TPA: MFS transporter [Candidatus Margulisiibacteriota bacterium]|nr:MFS transporter [Candidatus Margulisiibacteriota bacterium]